MALCFLVSFDSLARKAPRYIQRTFADSPRSINNSPALYPLDNVSPTHRESRRDDRTLRSSGGVSSPRRIRLLRICESRHFYNAFDQQPRGERGLAGKTGQQNPGKEDAGDRWRQYGSQAVGKVANAGQEHQHADSARQQAGPQDQNSCRGAKAGKEEQGETGAGVIQTDGKIGERLPFSFAQRSQWSTGLTYSQWNIEVEEELRLLPRPRRGRRRVRVKPEWAAPA
jgi:hypothetical protein